jgi:hypothetical protein
VRQLGVAAAIVSLQPWPGGRRLAVCLALEPRSRGGRILSVPYPQELNDSAAIIGRHVDAHDFAALIIGQFDEVLEQSRDGTPLPHIAAHRDRCRRRVERQVPIENSRALLTA